MDKIALLLGLPRNASPLQVVIHLLTVVLPAAVSALAHFNEKIASPGPAASTPAAPVVASPDDAYQREKDVAAQTAVAAEQNQLDLWQRPPAAPAGLVQ